MNKTLEAALIKKYPTLYPSFIARKSNRTTKNCAFECKDGWFSLIDTLSELIVLYSPNVHVQAIKQNNGRLDFQLMDYELKENDFLTGLITMAKSLSEIICEVCGDKGTLFYGDIKTVRCKWHHAPGAHFLNIDFPISLPLQTNHFGVMWHEMIVYLDDQFQMYHDYEESSDIKFTKIAKEKEGLCIEYEGGDKTTEGMLALILAYAKVVDEETGAINITL